MKRSDLITILNNEDLDAKAKLDKIMDLHGADAELWKTQKQETAEQHKEELGKLNGKLADALKTATDPDREDWKAKYEAEKTARETAEAGLATEKTAHEATKSGYETEKARAATKSALYRHLKAAGANPDEDILALLAGKFDQSALVLDGDNIKDWETLSKPVVEANEKWFGATTTEGVSVGNPPTMPPTTYTRADIEKMTPEQINANWEKIKPALEGKR